MRRKRTDAYGSATEGALDTFGGVGGRSRPYPVKGGGFGKGKRPQGEVSHLTQGQKTFIDRFRQGKGGSSKKQGGDKTWQDKKSLDAKQKVTKKKKSKSETQLSKEQLKKHKKMRAEGRASKTAQLKQRELYGDWLKTTPKAVRERIKTGGKPTLKKWKKDTKKKLQESWTPPPVEGIPRPKK